MDRRDLRLSNRGLESDLFGTGADFRPAAVAGMHALQNLYQTEAAERGQVARDGTAIPAQTRGDSGDRAGVGFDGAKQRQARRREEPQQVARFLERDDLSPGNGLAGVGKLCDLAARREELIGLSKPDRNLAHRDLRFRNPAIPASNRASMSSKLENATGAISPTYVQAEVRNTGDLVERDRNPNTPSGVARL